MRKAEEILAIEGAYIERAAVLRAIEMAQQETIFASAAVADRRR